METRIVTLLKEATEWRLLGLLFECPGKNWVQEITDLASEARDPDLRRAAGLAVKHATEGKYHSIFGPGGPAPAREVSYRTWVQPGYLLSELRTYYEAFSFYPETDETPDHVSVETAFLSYLSLKEAFAYTVSETENAQITSDAAQKFKEEHLAKIASPLAQALKSSGEEYLSIAGAALLERAGPDNESTNRKFLPVLGDSEDDKFECGMMP